MRANLLSLSSIMLLGSLCDGAELSLRVMDNAGGLISGAEVTAYYYEERGVGQGWGIGKTLRIRTTSGEEGIARLNVPDSTDSVSVSKVGFYSSSLDDLETATLLRAAIVDPNHAETIVLRRVLNPVAMYVRHVGFTPIPGADSAFDLMVGDWVAPQGRGEEGDLTIRVDRVVRGLNDFNYKVVLVFSGGALAMKRTDLDRRSAFKFPYHAPTGGYEESVILSGFMEGIEGNRDINGDQNAGYIFSLARREIGGGHRLMSGKILGAIHYDPKDSVKESYGSISFRYYLNPLGSGLEWDTKNNLFSDIRVTPIP
jgi:hypothetical protein